MYLYDSNSIKKNLCCWQSLIGIFCIFERLGYPTILADIGAVMIVLLFGKRCV